MRRNPYSTGYVAQKIRANTARRNAGLDLSHINLNAKIDVDKAVRDAKFLMTQPGYFDGKDSQFEKDMDRHLALAEAIMCQMMGVRATPAMADAINQARGLWYAGNESHPFTVAHDKAFDMAFTIVDSGKWTD